MGGGTAVVEGIAAGRNVIGNDLNSLAVFITKVKITLLDATELAAINEWVLKEVPGFNYHLSAVPLNPYIDQTKTKNLSMVKARFIKKAVAAALASITSLPTENARDFAKCIVLRVGQWALDGRERHTPLSDFRQKLSLTATEMIESISKFSEQAKRSQGHATILNMNAAQLHNAATFGKQRVSLVVTSPPYPGVHVLYHRWQVNGRRETPAPYWIAGCNDGQGASFYNFGDRSEAAADTYFGTLLATLHAIRRVMHKGAHMVQLLAFNRPEDQLPRYLQNMRSAGFEEIRTGDSRIWREVPNRKWHAAIIGRTHSSNEVVLVHKAV